jgi:hypothetical protein
MPGSTQRFENYRFELKTREQAAKIAEYASRALFLNQQTTRKLISALINSRGNYFCFSPPTHIESWAEDCMKSKM